MNKSERSAYRLWVINEIDVGLVLTAIHTFDHLLASEREIVEDLPTTGRAKLFL